MSQSVLTDDERRRLILDSALDAIIVMDSQGWVQDWNRQAEAMFGWSVEEAVGRRLSDLIIPEEHRMAHDRGMRHFLATGQGPILNHRIETVGLRRNGERFPIELTVAPARSGVGWIFSSFIRDLTERKAFENRLYLQLATTRILSESQDPAQVFKSLLDAILERTSWEVAALWTVKSGRVESKSKTMVLDEMRDIDPESFRTFRLTSQRLSLSLGAGIPGRVWNEGKPIWIPDIALESGLSRMSEAMSTGLRTALAFPVSLQGTVLGVIELFARPYLKRDAAMEDVLVSIGHQLGQFLERKNAEDGLRRRDKQLRIIMDAAPALISYIDINLRFLFVNKAYEEWFGLHEGELLGMSVIEALGPKGYAKAKPRIAEVLLGREVPFEDTVVSPVGGERSIRGHYHPLRDEEGDIEGFVAFILDVTDRKRMEEELRQSQKMESVGRLAGGIAHDFNNLLTAIIGFSDLAINSAEDPVAVLDMVGEIRRSGERAAALTGQLLAFSRKQMLVPRILDLNSVVSGIETLLRRVIGEDIELKTVLGNDLPPVLLDPSQLEQIILNLALNARDAMRKGGLLTLETAQTDLDAEYVGAHPDARPGPHLVLAVSDTGTGMAPEVKARLFEPFFTTKGPGKGTGMGLATVYGIVKQSGGHIHVYSEPGRGSSFKIYFPESEIPATPPDNPPPEKAPLIRGRGEVILLVEDEEAIRNYASRVLESLGYHVLLASHGRDALTISADAIAVDLLLTDVVMPGMSGRELWESLKSRLPSLRVLFMSGYTENAIVHHGVLDEDAPFLHKPFSPAQLAQKVRENLPQLEI